MNKRIIYHSRQPKEETSCCCGHCGEDSPTHTGRNKPMFTIGFEFDDVKRVLFIGWSKPEDKLQYVKKFGIGIVNARLDKMIKNYPNVTNGENMPKKVKDNLDFYISSACRYFKEIGDPATIKYHI